MIGSPSARTFAALALTSLVATGCSDGENAARRSLALSECRLPKFAVAAQCGTLTVPENRATPQGRQITLTVAILPANTLSPRPDPLFILAGGPGQAATYLAPFAAQLTGVRKDRDIVLVDQRGTGRSSPLACAAFAPDESIDRALDLDPVPRAAACAEGAPRARHRPCPVHDRRVRSRTSMRCARRSATRRSTCGAAPTEPARRSSTCVAIRTACAASCSTASPRRR